MQLRYMRFNGKPFGKNLCQFNVDKRQIINTTYPCDNTAKVDKLCEKLTTVTGSGVLAQNSDQTEIDYMRCVFGRGDMGTLIVPNYPPMVAVLSELDFCTNAQEQSVTYKFKFTIIPSEDNRGIYIRHKVADGENLWHIANRYSTTVGDLLSLNPNIIMPDRLQGISEVTVLCR